MTSVSSKLNSFDEVHFAFQAFQKRINESPAEDPSAQQDQLIKASANKVVAAVKRSKAELSKATFFDRAVLQMLKREAEKWYESYGDHFDVLYSPASRTEINEAYGALFSLIEQLEKTVTKTDEPRTERTIQNKILGLAGVCFGFVLALIMDNSDAVRFEGPQRETVEERRERTGRFIHASYMMGNTFADKDAGAIGKKVLEHPEQYMGVLNKAGKALGFANGEAFIGELRKKDSPLFEKLSPFAIENIVGRTAITKVTENVESLKVNLDKMQEIEVAINLIKDKTTGMDKNSEEYGKLLIEFGTLDAEQTKYTEAFDTILAEQERLRVHVGKKAFNVPQKILDNFHLRQKAVLVTKKPLTELTTHLKRLERTRGQFVIDLDPAPGGKEGHVLYVSMNPPRFCDIADRGIADPVSKVREFNTVDELLTTVALYTQSYQKEFPTFSLQQY